MAALILVVAGLILWLEVDAMKRLHRSSLRHAHAAYEPPPGASVTDVIAHTVGAIAVLLDLRACWFEPFPFDTLLPRIEQGRIALPSPEPGVVPCAGNGVELPVRFNGLTIGRFVLIPREPSVGVIFSPTDRHHAMVLAAQVAERVAVELISSDAALLLSERGSEREREYPGRSLE